MSDYNIDFLKVAKECYEAYGESVKWKNTQGKEIPQFSDLPDQIKSAWVAAVTKCLDLNLSEFKA